MNLLKKKVGAQSEQDKIAARREEVLAAGRKFKYPFQWTRHRVVINTILIAFIVLVVLIISGGLALYQFGMTNDLLFRVTEVLPLPVAVVDSENVRFSDYLIFYRSSITSIERQSGSQFDDGSLAELQAEYKRSALTNAEQYTYALKLAKALDLAVSDAEVDAEFDRHLKIGDVNRSETGFIKIINDNFGLSKDEYRRMLYLTLVKAKVEIAIDTKANDTAEKVAAMLAANGNNYNEVAAQLGDAIVYQETGGLVDGKNIDGGRAAEAMKLEPGQSSGKFLSINGDGYYFVKLINKTATEVNFVSIKVPFTEFATRMAALREDGLIDEYIHIATDQLAL